MRILHLSDLHFGELLKAQRDKHKQISGHFFTKSSGLPDPSRLSDILLSRDPMLKSRAPELVIVSGDIGWSGSEVDYQYALEFLNNLKNIWKETKFVISPGNHDVNWELSEKGENPQIHFIKFLHEFFGEHEFNSLYGSSFDQLSCASRRHDLTSFIYLKENDLAPSVAVVNVNSAFELTHKSSQLSVKGEKPEVPRIHPEALINLEKHLEKLGKNTLKIFVLHHHLLPFVDLYSGNTSTMGELCSPVDTTMIANSAQVQGWLARNGFDLTLHGHKHISHSRLDSLAAGNLTGRRRMIISGAGSASVTAFELPSGEKHSYSVIDVNPGRELQWNIRVESRDIPRSHLELPSTGYVFQEEVGESGFHNRCNYFIGENWHHVHGAISNACWPAEGFQKNVDSIVLNNFISVVSNIEEFELMLDENVGQAKRWDVPKTCRNGASIVLASDIEKTFCAIHPEYYGSNQWRDHEKILEILSEQHRRFHFRHGSRLFETSPGKGIKDSPLWLAANNAKSRGTQAYATTFRPDIDSRRINNEPMPSLIGIQFLEEKNRLNIVATFRNLELSYWWAVNYVELSRILHWALDVVGDQGLKCGSITMISPIAQWKWDPRASGIDELDSSDFVKISKIVKGALNFGSDEAIKLKAMLEEKEKNTSIYSLEDRGLLSLSNFLVMLIEDGSFGDKLGKNINELNKNILRSAECIREAIRNTTKRADYASKARVFLIKAIEIMGLISERGLK